MTCMSRDHEPHRACLMREASERIDDLDDLKNAIYEIDSTVNIHLKNIDDFCPTERLQP